MVFEKYECDIANTLMIIHLTYMAQIYALS